MKLYKYKTDMQLEFKLRCDHIISTLHPYNLKSQGL